MNITKISIIDPNVLAEVDGELYRFIYKSTERYRRWEQITDFVKTDYFKKLIEIGYMVDHTLVDGDVFHGTRFSWESVDDVTSRIVFKVRRIKSFSFARDWTRKQLKDIILRWVDINIYLQKNGSDFWVTEGLDGNFTFDKSNPMLIDTGAFSKNNLFDVNDIMERELKRLNVKLDFDFKRPLSISFLKEYRDKLETFAIPESSNYWDNYNKKDLPTYVSDIIPATPEEEYILSYVKKLSVKELVDVGCNNGTFARLFAKEGIHVTAIDNAPNCINVSYQIASSLELPIASFNIDLTKTDLKIWGKSAISRMEKDGDWIERFASECVVASSITHHLYNAGMNWSKQFNMFERLSTKYLLIEFIDKNDPHIQFDNQYSKESFLNRLKNNWEIMDTYQYEPYRTWYFLKQIERDNNLKIVWGC